MRKLLYLCTFIVLYSCNVEYDGETRLVSQTRLVDTDGNPLAGKRIKIIARDFSLSDMISDGLTDENGEATFVFPAPNNTDAEMDIIIESDGNYLEKQFLNIKRADFTDYKFSLNNLALYKSDEVTNLFLTLNQTTANTSITEISIPDNAAATLIYVNPSEEITEVPNWFAVTKNSTVTLKYVVKNGATSTTYTVPLTIGNYNVDYTITY